MSHGSALILTLAALSFSVFGCGNAATTSPSTPPYEVGLDSITVEHSRRYVEALASDSLAGRGAGTPGGAAAADSIAGWLGEIGVEPLFGESYFQTFDPERTSELAKSSMDRRFRELDPKRRSNVFAYLDHKLKGLGVRNVLGRIEGVNPDEYVVVGAHYDHVGTDARAEGDAIFNGADDNASGVAGVLQIARAFTASGEKPRRTVIFALWDAEEVGLLGSTCFVEGFEGMDRVKAYFNLDMIGRDDAGEGGGVACYSADTLRYARFAEKDAVAYGLDIEPVTDDETLGRDFKPMMFMWDRDGDGRRQLFLPGNSDYAPFQQADVPIYMMSTGMHADYHRPGDEAGKIDYPKMTMISKLAYLTVYRLANPEAEIVYPTRDTLTATGI